MTAKSLRVLTREEMEMLLTLQNEKIRRAEVNRIAKYVPYEKQAEFHALGATKRERLLTAGNQLGKTFAAACEASYHLTGLYPDWWEGRRFEHANAGWCSSVSMEVSRDAAQRLLLGKHGERGTGAIPGDKIISISPHRGVAGAASIAKIRHISGGVSTVTFKSYDQGRIKFQGDSTEWQWPDEEPPKEIYTEILTRTNARNGMVFMTFTPLLGKTAVVERFDEVHDDRAKVRMTIYDVGHYTDEQRAQIIASYPEHERKARIMGLPMQGEGMVFPIAQERVEFETFSMPAHWPRIAGMDFGWDHPTAVVWAAWDRDNDIIYIYDCHAESKQVPVFHAAAIRRRGDWIPVAWPQDGLQTEKGSGKELAQQYKDEQVKMLDDPVRFENGSNSVEAGIMEMMTRFQLGTLKIAKHLEGIWDEFVTYHRKDGLIVKKKDDRLDAIRYAIMGKRFAITKPEPVDINDFAYETDY